MLLPHGAVVALVDGKNFELYRNGGDEASPELTKMDSPKLNEHNHSGGSHHSSSGNPGGHQGNEDAHAIAAVNWLNSQVLGHKIDKLVVFAAPKTLGEMRRHYHKQTERAIIKEFHKDLIGKQAGDILAHMREGH